MRALLVLGMFAACGDDRAPQHDARPADAAIDAPFTCAPTLSCADGPGCGAGCCGTGEHCVGGTCMCGNGPSCSNGDTCMGAGIAPGPCGSVCCGVTVGCPI